MSIQKQKNTQTAGLNQDFSIQKAIDHENNGKKPFQMEQQQQKQILNYNFYEKQGSVSTNHTLNITKTKDKSMEDNKFQTIKILQKQLQKKILKTCNLCNVKNKQPHSTKQCPFSTVLYHVTSLQTVQTILKSGFHPQKRQLGRAVYVSDDSLTCMKYAFRNKDKFIEPTLIKLRANALQVLQIKNSKEVLKLDKQQLAARRVQCIKYPIYKLNNRLLYQWAMYKCDYAIISFSLIQFPKTGSDYGEKPGQHKLDDIEKATLIDEILRTPIGGSTGSRKGLQTEKISNNVQENGSQPKQI